MKPTARPSINGFAREGHFDIVLDFDIVVRDPRQPEHLRSSYDCGDHLHPSPAGYKAIGESIPLSLFER